MDENECARCTEAPFSAPNEVETSKTPSSAGLTKAANPNYDPVYLQKLQLQKIPSSEPTEAENVDFDSSGLIDFIPC